MRCIGHMVCFNEFDFIEQSIESVINHLDKLIIFEGSWGENYKVNGNLRSTDGTIEILDRLQKKYPKKIEIYFLNEKTQLEQRTAVFRYLPRDEDYLLWLIDGDEVYEEEEASKVAFEAKKNTSIESRPLVWTFQSLIFVNDFYNYSPVRYPRLFRIRPQSESDSYEFIEPNHISRNGFPLNDNKLDSDIRFFHYSYCHSPERFKQKKKERTKVHGNFAWELRDGLVQRDDANILPFEGEHPEIMKQHPLFGVRKHRKIESPKRIVYVEHSGIGNLVLATPMLQALRQSNPDAHIYVVCWKRSSRILEGADYIDSVIDEPKQLAQLNEIDTLLIPPLTVLPDVEKFLINKSKKTIRVDAIQPWTQHEAERKMVLAKKMGYRGPTPHPSIPIFDYNIENVKNYSPDIIINASCLKEPPWHLKHWGNKNYAELVTNLLYDYHDFTYAFVGTSSDYNNAEQIIIDCQFPMKDRLINLCGFSDDIKDTAALIKKSRTLIGNDGGLAHIAAALEVPTISIFTFTNPIKNKAMGNKAQVVMKSCKQRLFCQHGRWQDCEKNGCLNVPVEDVIKVAKSEIKKTLLTR